jgi:hypothetical protein
MRAAVVCDSSDRLIRNVPLPRIETYWLATELPRLTIGIGRLTVKGTGMFLRLTPSRRRFIQNNAAIGCMSAKCTSGDKRRTRFRFECA